MILLVDDEPTITATLSHHLRSDYRVQTAADGHEALEIAEREGPFAVILTDLRMPEMDGIELLREIARRHPHTVRVLHTAQADLDTALYAINSGQIYRFLRKPCPPRDLRDTIRDAVERHRLTMAEQTMLDTTLRQSMQALFGCLELASPGAFARAGRIRALVTAICDELAITDAWAVEVAAMASQLGVVTLPPGVLEKLENGLPLPADEQRMVDALPDIAIRLLSPVPMLDEVLDILRSLRGDPARPGSGGVPPAGRILRAAIDFERYETHGVPIDSALAVLESVAGPDVKDALRRVKGLDDASVRARPLTLGSLRVGMRIVADVCAPNGLVLIGRGALVTEVLIDRLTNFKWKGQLVEPILAIEPDRTTEPAG